MLTYTEARDKAREQSKEGCVQHVNAVILTTHAQVKGPEIVGYTVSDWTDGTTVASFYKGREL